MGLVQGDALLVQPSMLVVGEPGVQRRLETLRP